MKMTNRLTMVGAVVMFLVTLVTLMAPTTASAQDGWPGPWAWLGYGNTCGWLSQTDCGTGWGLPLGCNAWVVGACCSGECAFWEAQCIGFRAAGCWILYDYCIQNGGDPQSCENETTFQSCLNNAAIECAYVGPSCEMYCVGEAAVWCNQNTLLPTIGISPWCW